MCRSTEDSNTETIRCSQMRHIRLRPRIRHSIRNLRPSAIQPNALAKSDISGKIVDTENDISVNDIPMDGKVHLFILKDYSKVIGKAWTADGKIATSVYVLEQQSQPQTTTDNSREWLQKQFDEIKDILMDKATTPQIGK